GGDVRTRRFDAQGEGDYRRAVWPQLLGLIDQCDQPAAGCESGAICRPPIGRSLSLSDPRCALRTVTRERCDRQPGGLIAIGIDWDGRCQVLAVDLANPQSPSSWPDSRNLPC